MSSDYEKKLADERVSKFFDWAERNNFALSPLQANSKIPLAEKAPESFHSKSRADWVQWRDEGLNFALHCAVNGLVAVDIDPRNGGIGSWSAWQAQHGSFDFAWTTPNSGVHVLFKAPPGVELVQRSIGAGLDTRFRGYLCVPPSTIGDKRYMMHRPAPIHEPPAALIEAMRKVQPDRTTTVIGKNEYTAESVAKMMSYLDSCDAFDEYPDWISAGMSLRPALGDDEGFAIWWDVCCDHETETVESSWAKWLSFASEPKAGSVTLNSWMWDAHHNHDWKGRLEKSLPGMFGSAIGDLPGKGAPSIVPTLAPGTPGPANAPAAAPVALSLLAGQAAVAELGRSAVEAFIDAQSRFGAGVDNAPRLPDTCNSPLFDLLNTGIALTLQHARLPKLFRTGVVADFLAVLSASHQPTFEAVCARIKAEGCALVEGRVSAAVKRFEAQVQREARTGHGFIPDHKGNPDPGNSDNCTAFLRILGVELRYNGWSCRPEIKWPNRDGWTPLQDKDFGELLTTAENTDYRFRPREGMFKRALLAIARETVFDPVLARIAAAQANWDGVKRVDTALARACGVPSDAYHTAVSRNLFGGIVKRARHPGCKHDEVVILIGPQGTDKSNFTKVIALDPEWHSDSVTFDGSPQNVIPQLFGKLVIELAELDGMARREVQHIKRILTVQINSVTLKYEAFSSDYARRCCFVGTSNDDTPLRDLSGGRRFLPVHVVDGIDIEWVRANIEQIIGEAATLEAEGIDFSIPRTVWNIAGAHQEAARPVTQLEVLFEEWFGESTAGDAYISATHLGRRLKAEYGRPVEPAAYGAAMRKLGFRHLRHYILPNVRERGWLRGDDYATAKRYGEFSGKLYAQAATSSSTVPPPPY